MKLDDVIKITNTYWEMLKLLNDDIKLRLATRLTASVVTGKTTRKDKTEEMLEKHLGKWKIPFKKVVASTKCP